MSEETGGYTPKCSSAVDDLKPPTTGTAIERKSTIAEVAAVVVKIGTLKIEADGGVARGKAFKTFEINGRDVVHLTSFTLRWTVDHPVFRIEMEEVIP